MKKTIKINASVSGVLPTAPYANLKPGFLIEETFEVQDHKELTEDYIREHSKALYDIVYGLLKEVENSAVIERIERERADLRFVASPTTGKMLPSVTSIINYDADFFVSAEDLRQYASAGQITHSRVAEFIRTGEWKDAKDIPDVYTDSLIVSKGNLKLPLNTGDFPGFLKKYPIENMESETRGFDDKHEYCGEPDFRGLPLSLPSLSQFAEQITTIFDIKRTPAKVKDGMQLSAYCNLMNIKQGIVIPLNDKTEKGFSKPIIYNEKELSGYWKMFLQKRNEFRKRYNI